MLQGNVVRTRDEIHAVKQVAKGGITGSRWGCGSLGRFSHLNVKQNLSDVPQLLLLLHPHTLHLL